ncbi:MAG: acyl-CoA dehydrogenase [Proteobacteria bacterium]|nr:MAG: acyl-CoA dehydrogenase [Pseudomonadota bacterium]
MSYTYPYEDAAFLLQHVLDFDALCEQADLADVNTDLALNVLEEAGKLGSEVLAPLNRVGDLQGAQLGDQGVEASPGFKDAYQQFAEGGWMSLSVAEQYGGQNLPSVLATAVNEIWQSANLAFALCPLLTQGAISAIAHHASAELKETYLPKMASGEWSGTMNLTESDAGSDLAAVKTRAVPDGEHYRLSGQKIFITWGDHQMTENIVHLVLARLPGAPAGVKGISLFIVPKFLLDAEGNPAERNGVQCLSLEHKLGIHASPTCVMEFKDAVGYLVGEAHRGLPYMFTMMNHARQAVGVQGLAVSARAYQQAVPYAKERLQGTRKDGSRIPIIQFPDVRRMLMTMKAATEAMRALALAASAEADWAQCAKTDADRQKHFARLELFTPIVKGWLTELGQEMTSLNIQVHGGMGFIEETGAAQHYRDARILPIYEGTNGIQALDLVGRKTLMDQGAAMKALLEDIQATVNDLKMANYSDASVTEQLTQALAAARQAVQFLLEHSATNKDLPGAISFNFLMLMGYLSGGWLMAKAGLQAKRLLDANEGDAHFYQNKMISVRFYAEHLLSRTQACLGSILAGTDSMMALAEDNF